MYYKLINKLAHMLHMAGLFIFKSQKSFNFKIFKHTTDVINYNKYNTYLLFKLQKNYKQYIIKCLISN